MPLKHAVRTDRRTKQQNRRRGFSKPIRLTRSQPRTDHLWIDKIPVLSQSSIPLTERELRVHERSFGIQAEPRDTRTAHDCDTNAKLLRPALHGMAAKSNAAFRPSCLSTFLILSRSLESTPHTSNVFDRRQHGRLTTIAILLSAGVEHIVSP